MTKDVTKVHSTEASPEYKYPVGTRIWWSGYEKKNGYKFSGPQEVNVIEIAIGSRLPYKVLFEDDYTCWVGEETMSPLLIQSPIDWRVGDWAWHVDSENYGRLIKLETLVFVHMCFIPTPEQLLVEYKGRKCLAWEDEDGYIIVQYGNRDSERKMFIYKDYDDDRFLVPDCLVVVSYDQWYERKHWCGEPPEYPRGE